ncbi:MAG: hypothetical protein AB7T06_47630, partial [Kofleriaceae bacterium]
LTGLLLSVAAAGLIGCGDSSVECGEGTELDDDGFCVPTGEPVMCTDGTMLDETTNSCVIDPASCQGGTVLIGDACVDPTSGLTADVSEAVEPNGFGIGGEDSDTPAGEFQLKPVGQKVILKGNINPQADRDEDGAKESDFDSYLFEATDPTLLEISVDGVGGAAGGFVIFGAIDGLEGWQRFGVNLTGDTSKRQVYLPAAGIYLLAIADTRSLVLGEPTGDPDNSYYVTVEQKAVPTATTLTFTNGDVNHFGRITDGEVDFVTAPLDLGFHSVDLTSYDEDFSGSLIAMQGQRIRAISDEDHSTSGDAPASAFYGGVPAGATSTFVIDHVINTSSAAVDYRLHIKTRGAAALSTNGMGVMQTNKNPAATTLDDYTYWFFDTNNTNQLNGFDLTWNVPFTGLMVDEDGLIVARFTNLAAGTRFLSYKGLIRTNAPGRYYFIGYAPAPSTNTTMITATSTITEVTPTALAYEQALTAVAPNATNGNAFTYMPGDEPWQQIVGSADAASGGASIRVFNPANSYGRMGTYVTQNDAGVTTTVTGTDATPLVFFTAAASATNDRGLITPGLPDTVLITAQTAAGAGTFDLSTEKHDYNDEGDHAPPFNTSHAAQDLTTTGFQDYLLKTTPGAVVTITATPDLAEDLVILQLDTPEAVVDFADSGLSGDAETLEVVADSRGYVAFSVFEYDGLPGSFEIEIDVAAAPVPYYVIADSTTAWVNVCNAAGATDITPATTDDALTATVTLPADFTFFAGAQTQAKISTNGWLSFDTALTGSFAFADPFPTNTTPNGLISPYWDDLVNVRICTNTVGTKFYVQWRGTVYGTSDTVATQLILDAADDSIEFVYAPYHRADGAFAAAGVESSTGSQGTQLFYDEDLDLAGKSKKLTHP